MNGGLLSFLPGLDTVNQAIIIIAAFSAIVFVHELGHYLAARLTGVRVERFFIGFDIFGLALEKGWRGTVYGVGILPLGGYCALAGQNDDPRKEIRTGAPDEIQAKPLWARSLVFAGGVLMNFLFGFLILIAAFMYGIPFIPPVLGELDPRGPAAVHGFLPGDRVLRVDDRRVESFEEAAEAIALSGAGGEVMVEVERRDASGIRRILSIRVKGRASGGRGNLNSIGAEPERSRRIGGIVEDPAFTGPLAGKLAVNDEIIAVDGVEIPENQGGLIQRLLANRPGEEARLKVKSARDGEVREVLVPLETYGEWDLGLRIGVEIVGVTPGGPADRAGLSAGDLVTAYEIADPDGGGVRRLASTEQFMRAVIEAALRPVDILLKRKSETIAARVTPKVGTEMPDPERDTLLGLEGVMEGGDGFRIGRILPGSPLEKIAEPGDLLAGLAGRPLPAGKSLREAVEEASSHDLKLFLRRGGENRLAAGLREVTEANLTVRLSPRVSPRHRRPMIGVDLAPGPVTSVEAGSFADTALGGAARLAGSRLAALQYSPDLATTILRFVFPADSPYGGGLKTLVAATPGKILENPGLAGLLSRLPVSFKTAEEVRPLPFFEAVGAAGKKWVDLSLMVYSVIHKLVVRTLPLDAVGGPVQLFRIIKIADDRGFAYFLYIVALISVNLGVCNLLPFPVLDGGHLAFLLIEWLIGGPPPRLVRDTAQWIGLICLLALMLTVTGYDILHLLRGTG
ncbi:MAG: site-2 protease family protein [Planctomycetota bacterium]|jgi:regulator of sigma E protease|nr:site-2 protease family protein [Planctomycetota bacterium]